MKECKVCKTVNADDTQFCHVCGSKFPDQLVIQTISGNTLEDEKKEKNGKPKEHSPKRFEYLVIDSLFNTISDIYKDDLEKNKYEPKFVISLMSKYLNQLGNDGWELIMQEHNYRGVLVFKRDKDNDAI
jgi:hypothetical protein